MFSFICNDCGERWDGLEAIFRDNSLSCNVFKDKDGDRMISVYHLGCVGYEVILIDKLQKKQTHKSKYI